MCAMMPMLRTLSSGNCRAISVTVQTGIRSRLSGLAQSVSGKPEGNFAQVLLVSKASESIRHRIVRQGVKILNSALAVWAVGPPTPRVRDYHLKWAKALLASAILWVSSFFLMADPSFLDAAINSLASRSAIEFSVRFLE
jgi:hypothetical protein